MMLYHIFVPNIFCVPTIKVAQFSPSFPHLDSLKMDQHYPFMLHSPTASLTPLAPLAPLTSLSLPPTNGLISPALTSAGLSPTQFGPLPPLSAMAGLSLNGTYSEERPVSRVPGLPRLVDASWSAEESNSNTSKGPLERLGFKIMLGGEKKTRGK
jgi:hypothetical protein